ncbi:GMP synthetase (glutamine aminotransferase) [Candidatus Promineifilum breve]|uniref:GMP synthase [glutamine-hydrolyzing] n=1 Tax=Candidatus Promineifilum breve TaxID=1806508 RepID=A0A160T6P9_9CHLR|nr:glutamine-hydrolyzing GMP synthase [Candidatus Promineifilum breve]CUS05704.1 GMP synthetase (glutamine aminotransferase) [Candidatus Promineifilum breve]
MNHDTIVVLDYGSQYAQLIVRRVREANVYCELVPWNAPAADVLALQPKGFILSGGPNSVYDPGAPTLPDYVLQSGAPVLGICYGMQLLAHRLGGQVAGSTMHEYGPATLTVDVADDPLFAGWDAAGPSPVWMSHGDRVAALPPGFRPLAHSANSPFAAAADPARATYAVQFHPEVAHTPRGRVLLSNFVHRICGCAPDWTPANFIDQQTAAIRAQVGDGRVVLGLSGGLDSAVAAALIHRAVGDQLTCIFVDTGLLRAGEPLSIVQAFQQEQGIRLIAVNAIEEYLAALDGVSEPEQKRRLIGEKFVRIFEREARALGRIDFLAQGTIYPDVIESAGPGRGEARVIKTHHNVGGLPADMEFELVEPLRPLFKDEVRRLGLALGLPERIIYRQPFPGPGLAVRCLGEITWERLERLRQADAIFLEELTSADLLREGTQQAFAVLLPVKSVGVMGDYRTYKEVVALRAVTTEDFMTADWARLPYDVLAEASRRIVNEVPGVNRVVFDITSKPPGTIEWE